MKLGKMAVLGEGGGGKSRFGSAAGDSLTRGMD